MNVCAQQAKKNPHLSGWQAVRVVNNLEQIVMRDKQVVKDGDFVVFKECDYEIPIADLTSQYFIAEWFCHMSQKTWVTKEMLCQFASIIQQLNNLGAK